MILIWRQGGLLFIFFFPLFYPSLGEELLKISMKKDKLSSKIILQFFCFMKQTSSQLLQMEVGYRLVFHTSNHQIYSYTLNISYLFLVILIVLSTSGFHLYFPGLSALQVFYMLCENVPLYPYFRPADGQFHFVPLLLYTMKQSFLTYFLHNVMTYPLNPHFSSLKSINLDRIS